jgi:hypothetical protein
MLLKNAKSIKITKSLIMSYPVWNRTKISSVKEKYNKPLYHRAIKIEHLTGLEPVCNKLEDCGISFIL